MEYDAEMTIWDYVDNIVYDSKEVTKGNSLFLQAKVVIERDRYVTEKIRYICARIKGEDAQNIELFLTHNYLGVDSVCSCTDFQKNGSCKHMAAVIFAANENDDINNIVASVGEEVIEEELALQRQKTDTFFFCLEIISKSHNRYGISFVLTDGALHSGRNFMLKKVHFNYMRIEPLIIQMGNRSIDISKIRLTRDALLLLKLLSKSAFSQIEKAHNKDVVGAQLQAFLNKVAELKIELPISYQKNGTTDFAQTQLGIDVPSYTFTATQKTEVAVNFILDEAFQTQFLEHQPFYEVREELFVLYPKILQQFLTFFSYDKIAERVQMSCPIKNVGTLIKQDGTLLGMHLNLEKSVEDLVKKVKVAHEIYISKSIHGVEIQVMFCYDEIKINALTDIVSSSTSIVVREYESEKQVLKILRDAEHVIISETTITIRDVADAFSFIEEKRQVLLDLGAKIFIDDTLKKIRTVPFNISIKSKATIDGTLDLSIDLDGLDIIELENIMKQYRIKRR
ncbi:hypothetical protein AwErysi_05250 [Erysipelotrichaceae bacterium]|nr:hypothetical protein AwErysi_05250 [Erysipelotrichaceae bacterium]